MTDIKPLIFIQEDYETQRLAYEHSLLRRGFRVCAAGTVDEGIMLARELAGQVDVAVLDMKMDNDAVARGRTGVDVGRTLIEDRRSPAPQFLFYTAYDETSYYAAAVELGAAAYLRKSGADNMDLMRHVRTLAVASLLSSPRHAASWPEVTIANLKTSLIDALIYTCSEFLGPTLERWLGVECCLFVRHQKQYIPVSAGLTATGEAHDYLVLDSLIQSSPTGCYISNDDVHNLSGRSPVGRLFDQVSTFTAIEIATVGELKVLAAFGRNPASPRPEIISSRAEYIGPLALRYIRPAVEARLSALRDLIALKTQQLEISRTQLRGIAGVADTTAQRLSDTLSLVEGQPTHAAYVQEQWRLVAELRELSATLATTFRDDAHDAGGKRCEMSEVITDVLSEGEKRGFLLRDLFRVSWSLPGAPVLLGRSQLYRVLRSLFTWLCNRALETPLPRPIGMSALLQVVAGVTFVILTLEDQSPTLPPESLESLFQPYAHPVSYPLRDGTVERGVLDLFLAHFLVQHAGGHLHVTPRGEPQTGHHVSITLPLAHEQQTTFG